jgi:hypothetical protein
MVSASMCWSDLRVLGSLRSEFHFVVCMSDREFAVCVRSVVGSVAARGEASRCLRCRASPDARGRAPESEQVNRLHTDDLRDDCRLTGGDLSAPEFRSS